MFGEAFIYRGNYLFDDLFCRTFHKRLAIQVDIRSWQDHIRLQKEVLRITYFARQNVTYSSQHLVLTISHLR